MFYSVSNLSAAAVTPLATLPEQPPIAPELPDVEYKRWCRNPDTRHMFISCFEGSTPALRVDEQRDNPVMYMHGLIAHYRADDGPANTEEFAVWLAQRELCEFRPTHLVRGRNCTLLIWKFGCPLLVAGREHLKAFTQELTTRLCLHKWGPKLDSGLLHKDFIYHEVGARNTRVSKDIIPADWLGLVSVQAFEKSYRKNDSFTYKVPLDEVAEAIQEKYPGKWLGRFEVGSKGPRFWDSSSDNPTAATVMADGMFCFTGGSGAFFSWQKLLGTAFVEKYERQAVGPVYDMTWYDSDNKLYWTYDEIRQHLIPRGLDEFRRMLQMRGLSDCKPRGEMSPLNKMVATIESTKWVDGAYPLPFYKPGIHDHKGRKYLNTYRQKALQPGAPAVTPGASWQQLMEGPFQHVFRWVVTVSASGPVVRLDDDPQFLSTLRWMQVAYEAALNEEPVQGQALVLTGASNLGKTFFGRCVVGYLLGGYSDGSQYMVQGTRFTSDIAEMPLCCIDDEVVAGDYRQRLAFTQRVKALVANGSLQYEKKFRAALQLPMLIRIIITCNDDPLSLRILPEMDLSTRDKILLIKSNQTYAVAKWPKSRQETGRILLAEMPLFAAWLREWKCPATAGGHVILDDDRGVSRRFGLAAYQHPDLLAMACEQGNTGLVIEALYQLFAMMDKNNSEKAPHSVWEGTAADLHQQLTLACTSGTGTGVMRDISHAHLGVILRNLQRNGLPVESRKLGRGVIHWVIQRAIFAQNDTQTEQDQSNMINPEGTPGGVE